MALKVILGDAHDMNSYRKIKEIVNKLCKHNMVDYFLQENAFNYVLKTKKEIEDKIKNEDYMISNLHYEIALYNNLPIIGIDLQPDSKTFKEKLVKQFQVREDAMKATCNTYAFKGPFVLTVGDTHLRTKQTMELGRASPLYTSYRYNKDTYIIRADKREIDIKLKTGPRLLTYDEFLLLLGTEEFIKKYSRSYRTTNLK